MEERGGGGRDLKPTLKCCWRAVKEERAELVQGLHALSAPSFFFPSFLPSFPDSLPGLSLSAGSHEYFIISGHVS